jgi:hypothetical protein
MLNFSNAVTRIHNNRAKNNNSPYPFTSMRFKLITRVHFQAKKTAMPANNFRNMQKLLLAIQFCKTRTG